MSFSTLSLLGTHKFWGGSYLSDEGSGGLQQILDTIIGKINEVLPYLNGASALDALLVGDSTNYYLTGHTWLIVDGLNPPTVSKLRMQDQADGSFQDVTVSSGSLTVTAA